MCCTLFVTVSRNLRCTKLLPADTDEVSQARIHCAQRISFPKEVPALQLFTKNCYILLICQLKLFLDENHTIRCGERIHNAMADNET